MHLYVILKFPPKSQESILNTEVHQSRGGAAKIRVNVVKILAILEINNSNQGTQGFQAKFLA